MALNLKNLGAIKPAAKSKATKGKTKLPKLKKSSAANGAAVTPNILIDDRLGSRDLVNHSPLDRCGILCRMEFGDVSFAGNGPKGDVAVGIEVKSMMDLIASMNTGRAQAQLLGMKKTYDVCWLLHYGIYRPNPTGLGTLQLPRGQGVWRDYEVGRKPIMYGEVEAFLASVTAIGVAVKRVASVEEAAAWIGVIARWWNKPWYEHKSFRTFNVAGDDSGFYVEIDPVTDQIANVLKGLPGLGYERAVRAAVHFPTLSAAMNASAEEWAEITTIDRRTNKPRRIGPVTAKAIVAAIHNRKPKPAKT